MKPLSLQKTFGATVTRLRTERKMSVEALSAVTRIWPTRLKGIEAGTAIVTLPEIGRLSSALGEVFHIGFHYEDWVQETIEGEIKRDLPRVLKSLGL